MQLTDSGEGSGTSAPLLVELLLQGHLSESVLAAALDRADHDIHAASSHPILVVDCLNMTGYDSGARSLFIAWNSRHRKKFLCVVVITQNKLWHMVVGTMALASGQKMRAFNDTAEAAPWISQQWSRAHPVA